MDGQQGSSRTGRGADIAFSVVVLASYFSVFSGLRSYSSVQIFLLILLGVAYIGLGIYGYSFCAKTNWPSAKIIYFAVQISLGGVIVYLGRGEGFNAMVLLPLTGHSVLLLTPIYQYAVNFFVLLTYIFAIQFISPGWEIVAQGLPTFLAGQIFIIVFTQMALTEEKNRAEVERLVHDLSRANQRLRNYLVQVEELSTEKERNRLAREIHDGLGHYLTTVHVQLEAARAVFTKNPSQAAELMDSAQKVAKEALIDIRRSVAALRSPIDENVSIEAQIQKLLVSAESAGIKPALHVVGDSLALDIKVFMTLYRIAQEGINNACKHSQATELNVHLDFSNEREIRMNIADNGIGSDHLDGGFGLLGLKERVQFVNGMISFSTEPGKGFSISVLIPRENDHKTPLS